MLRNFLAVCTCLTFAVSSAAVADAAAAEAVGLTAAQIVDKNVAARGGLQAWRAIQTLSFQGKLGVGGNQRATLSVPMPDQQSVGQFLPRRPAEEARLPFLMELKRGRKERFELQFNGKTAVQVYDGTNGWKLRPFLNRMEVESFTAEELKSASMQADLDGPLVDYVAKGSHVELDGLEKVQGRDTYKLKLTLKSGQALHVWVDAETFLESKIEGQPRRMDGTEHPVEVYFRDYRQVNGLVIPFVFETKVLPVAKTATGFNDTPVPVEKILLDNVVVNPKLDDSLFVKPTVAAAANPPHPLHLSN
jgi:outer membrane lipoprotein-sorting protein